MSTIPSLGLLLEAIQFAAEKHRIQKRKDEITPYINHPIALAHVLAVEGGIDDPIVLCAAILHDTIEDTGTTADELRTRFGDEVTNVVLEVTDDKSLPKEVRKRLQVEHASSRSRRAKLLKLADKICNLRDLTDSPPPKWSPERRREYFTWAQAVVFGLRGIHPGLESVFDQAYTRGTEGL